jgi:hypothetical protein
LRTLVLLAVGGGLFAAFVLPRTGAGVVESVRDALDDDAFDGDRVLGPTVSVDAGARHDLPGGAVGVHPLGGVEGAVTITVSGLDGFDPVLRVLDAGGDVRGEDDDGGEGTDARLALTLPGGPGATLEVREYGGDAGTYVVQVGRGALDDAPATASGAELLAGRPVDGVVASQQAVAHPYTGEGRQVAVTVEGLGGFDPTVRVLDAAGTVLAENDDADGRNSRVELLVGASVPVTVEVAGFAGRAGAYRVLVE